MVDLLLCYEVHDNDNNNNNNNYMTTIIYIIEL